MSELLKTPQTMNPEEISAVSSEKIPRMIHFLETGDFRDDDVSQALQFSIVDGILCFVSDKQVSKKQAVVPYQL